MKSNSFKDFDKRDLLIEFAQMCRAEVYDESFSSAPYFEEILRRLTIGEEALLDIEGINPTLKILANEDNYMEPTFSPHVLAESILTRFKNSIDRWIAKYEE